MLLVRKKNAETMNEMQKELEVFLKKYESGDFDQNKPPISARGLGSLRKAMQVADEATFFHLINMVGHEMGKIEVHYGLSLYLEEQNFNGKTSLVDYE